MEIPLYIVDAFTDSPFRGNPAAICPLENWLDDRLMQNIAAENNLSETAFFVRSQEQYQLRWFTPTVEVDLCGHATLASAFILVKELGVNTSPVRFHTRSGVLSVSHADNFFFLDFPARALEPVDLLAEVEACFKVKPKKVTRSESTLIAEFDTEESVGALKPDFGQIMALDCMGLIVTAPGIQCDFVSRFFAPKAGINEDPVTGSAHCGLIPYWYAKTGKKNMSARQISDRGGELHCECADNRVLIGGQAVLFSSGKIVL